MGTPTVVGVNNAAGQAFGLVASSDGSVTPTLPTGTAVGDRVIIFSAHSGNAPSIVVPTGWQADYNTSFGSGVPAAGTGFRRFATIWRDYDGVWTMPAVTLSPSEANISHWVGAIAIRPTSGNIIRAHLGFNTTSDFGTANTAHSVPSIVSITTNSGALMLMFSAQNDNVTSTGGSLTQTGATFSAVTEHADGGTATGNDVSGTIHSASVTTGANAVITFAKTLSAASEGGTAFLQIIEAPPPTAGDPEVWSENIWPGNFSTQVVATGNTGTGVLSSTPTIPFGTMPNGCRVFLWQVHNVTSGTTPTGWTALFKDEVVGSGAVGAGTGQRFLTCYYRDNDLSWSIPPLTTASAAAPTHAVGAFTVVKNSADSWNTPTYSTPGSDYGTPEIAHSMALGSLTTITNGVVAFVVATNDGVSFSFPSVSGGSVSAVAQTSTGAGSAVGNDVSGWSGYSNVTAGGVDTFTLAITTNAVTESGAIALHQMVVLPPSNTNLFFAMMP